MKTTKVVMLFCGSCLLSQMAFAGSQTNTFSQTSSGGVSEQRVSVVTDRSDLYTGYTDMETGHESGTTESDVALGYRTETYQGEVQTNMQTTDFITSTHDGTSYRSDQNGVGIVIGNRSLESHNRTGLAGEIVRTESGQYLEISEVDSDSPYASKYEGGTWDLTETTTLTGNGISVSKTQQQYESAYSDK